MYACGGIWCNISVVRILKILYSSYSVAVCSWLLILLAYGVVAPISLYWLLSEFT